MKTLAGVFLACLLVGLTMAYAQVAYRAGEGFQPDVITVKRTVSDTARVCVEPPSGGLLACRPVGELRKWVLDTKLK